MNVPIGLACLGLSLMLSVPAFCGPPAALIGKWQIRGDATVHSFIFEFKPNGTETVSKRQGATETPFTNRNGKPLTLKYTVSGNKLTTIYPDHKVTEMLFQVQGDTLTITKVLIFASQSAHGLHGSTLTRFKG